MTNRTVIYLKNFTNISYLSIVGNISTVYMISDPHAPDKNNLEIMAQTVFIVSASSILDR